MASTNAKAAAAASGFSIERGVSLDSLDARITQYLYGKHKLEIIMSSIRQLLTKPSSSSLDRQVVPQLNNILLLSGPIFNINDLIFKRFEILNNGGVFNPLVPIQASLNTNAINFDLNENLTNYDTTKAQKLPDRPRTLKTLTLFGDLCKNALQIYEERLRQALIERTINRPSFDISRIQDLLQFPELEIVSQLTMTITPDVVKEDRDVFFQQTDLAAIKLFTEAMDRCLAQLEPLITTLESCKQKSDITKEHNWTYILHRSLIIFLRLADLYAMLRKFGKRIFFQDYHYLKMLSQYYKPISGRLNSLDSCFNQPKKSNLLLASITKTTRQGSRQQVRPDTLLALGKDARNAFVVVQEATISLKDLFITWTFSAEDFTKRHGTSSSMNELREKAKNDVLKQRLRQSQHLLENRQSQVRMLEKLYVPASKSKAEAEAHLKFIKSIEDKAREDKLIMEALELDLQETDNRSRSSSISNSSISSPSKLSRSSSLQQKTSNTQISRSNSTRVAGSTPRSSTKRHSFIISSPGAVTPTKSSLNANGLRSRTGSISSADSSNSSPSVKLSPVVNSTGLRRSASLQHPSSASKNSAAAGAGAAFINRRSPLHDLTKSNSFQGASLSAQQRLQAKQQELARDGSYLFLQNPAAKKKPSSAQERLQLHILSQSKSGNMTVKPMAERPKIVYKHLPVAASPTPSIESNSNASSRNNSLKSPTLQVPSSPSPSRASSLQSISESPVQSIGSTTPKKALSTDGELLVSRMNRSRSNSLQNDELLSPSNSLKRNGVNGTRSRSNSASMRPSSGITKIEESDKTPEYVHGPSLSISSDDLSISANSLDDPTLTSSLLVTHEEFTPSAPKEEVKKVRFIGVPEYTAAEDAPSANRPLKNIRKVVFRTSSGVEITKKKEKMFTSQEGLAFRAFNQLGGSWEGFGSLSQKQNQIPSMRTLVQPQGGGKRLSKLFKTR